MSLWHCHFNGILEDHAHNWALTAIDLTLHWAETTINLFISDQSSWQKKMLKSLSPYQKYYLFIKYFQFQATLQFRNRLLLLSSETWRDSIHLEQCTFGTVYIWNSVHLEQCTFGTVYIWNSVHLGQCTFGTVYIWNSVAHRIHYLFILKRNSLAQNIPSTTAPVEYW